MQELVDRFLATYQARLKASTLRDYRSIFAHHLAKFPSFEALNQGLEDYLSGLDISGKRKNNILSAARSFVEWARRRKFFEGKFFKIPRFPHRSKKTKPLTPDEAQLIMDCTPWPYKDFFKLSILTGLRTGEALGLRFDDFDLVKKVIHVERSLTCGVIGTTKTMAGERDVPLLRPLWELFEARRRANHRASPWFFFSAHRGVLSLKKIRQIWRDFLDAVGIEPRVLYATRHTFASLAIAAGEDPLWVAKILGHERPDQLFLKYATFLEGMKEDGKKFLELAIGRGTFLRAVK
ncbi:MAG: site-specific integrase [Deltaproteobacteria bacterium]|nr:site-specific integrase [Deltaproteobacteria bacterium]